MKLSDTRVSEPQVRARLGTTARFCKVVVLKLRAVPVRYSSRISIVWQPPSILRVRATLLVQGYLAHKKPPHPSTLQ